MSNNISHHRSVFVTNTYVTKLKYISFKYDTLCFFSSILTIKNIDLFLNDYILFPELDGSNGYIYFYGFEITNLKTLTASSR